MFFFTGFAARYEEFYGSLSVGLEDIGLDYGGVLARSGEQIITPVFLVILSYSLLRLAQETAKDGDWRAGRAHTGRWRWLRTSRAWSRPFAWLILAAFVALALAGYAVELYSIDSRVKAAATAVRDGRPIEGIESKSGFTLLNVHVREARIEPMAKTNVASSIS